MAYLDLMWGICNMLTNINERPAIIRLTVDIDILVKICKLKAPLPISTQALSLRGIF